MDGRSWEPMRWWDDDYISMRPKKGRRYTDTGEGRSAVFNVLVDLEPRPIRNDFLRVVASYFPTFHGSELKNVSFQARQTFTFPMCTVQLFKVIWPRTTYSLECVRQIGEKGTSLDVSESECYTQCKESSVYKAWYYQKGYWQLHPLRAHVPQECVLYEEV